VQIIYNPAKLDTEVLALAETKLPHLRQKSFVRHDVRRTEEGGPEKTDPIDLSDFLRAYNQRNRGYTAEQTDEIAPSHCLPQGSGPRQPGYTINEAKQETRTDEMGADSIFAAREPCLGDVA
jgi:hypothetical protein